MIPRPCEETPDVRGENGVVLQRQGAGDVEAGDVLPEPHVAPVGGDLPGREQATVHGRRDVRHALQAKDLFGRKLPSVRRRPPLPPDAQTAELPIHESAAIHGALEGDDEDGDRDRRADSEGTGHGLFRSHRSRTAAERGARADPRLTNGTAYSSGRLHATGTRTRPRRSSRLDARMVTGSGLEPTLCVTPLSPW